MIARFAALAPVVLAVVTGSPLLEKPTCYPALEGLIGTAPDTRQITTHWDEIHRLATSIRQGTVTASLMLRKPGGPPPPGRPGAGRVLQPPGRTPRPDV